MAIFGTPSSTPGRDNDIRHKNLRMTFNSEQFLFEGLFNIISIFCRFQVNLLSQSSTLKYFKNVSLWGHLAPTPGGDRDMHPVSFLWEI